MEDDFISSLDIALFNLIFLYFWIYLWKKLDLAVSQLDSETIGKR